MASRSSIRIYPTHDVPKAKARAQRVEGETRLIQEILRLTLEAQRIADGSSDRSAAAVSVLSRAVELLLALVIVRMR